MDEFSWFVGLYEGEGCILYGEKGNQIYLSISMTDEDTIERASKYLDCSYRKNYPPSWKEKGWKPQYKVKPKGQRIVKLFETMLPYLSKRRQNQVTEKIEMYYKNKFVKRDGNIRKSVSRRKDTWP